MVCENVLEAIVMVIVPVFSIVNEGTDIVDALGMVVRVQLVSGQLNAPGAGDPAMSRDAEQFMVFVPSALCVTVVVPLAIVQEEFLAIEYLSDVFLS